MILQCDQCNTKFRLDDSKLKPGGVKVRCSKCRHVFVAGAEFKQEESEFDAILSGLGAPAPEIKHEAAPSPEAASDAAGFGFDDVFGEAPAAPSAPVSPAPVAPSAPVFPEASATALPPELPAAEEPAAKAPAGAFDQGEPAGHGAGEGAAQPDLEDFAAFDFAAGSFEPAEASAPAPEPALDFSAFNVVPELPTQAPQPASAAPALDYGEFSFDEEPAPLQEETAAAAEEPFEFGEFSFAAQPEAIPEPAAPPALGFGEFDFDTKPAEPAQESPKLPSGLEELDYGDFSFADDAGLKEEPAPAASTGKAVAAADDFDFGAFSFSEEPAQLQEEPAPAAKQDFDFGEFSFSEEPVVTQQAAAPLAAATDADAFSFSEPPPAKKPEAVPLDADDFNFDEFSFAPEPAAKPAQDAGTASVATGTAAAVAATAAADAVAVASGASGHAAAPSRAEIVAASEPSPLPVKAAAQPDAEAAHDFGLGAAPSTTHAPEQFELGEDEELPPLSISSRRKGRSLLTVSVVAVCALVIVALSGAGFYLLQSGPEAFDKYGLGFVAKWFGMESAEEGRVTVSKQQASFVQNKEAGELFVVTGEATNSFRNSRASILVKVSLFDKKGAVLLQKTAYCGNRLSEEQLATLPMAKIESIMNNQFGDSLANMGVLPGKSIGFVVAIPNVPKDAADFGVEVVGSTVASK
jgi:predicted Zn finger-like uncharacterized protein